jgi:predicted esterase
VIDAIEREFGEPSAIVHVGFSQGASMAYRAAALGARAAAGVIALGGDVPPELGDEALSRIRRVLVGWGVRDPFYTREKRERDEIRLRGAGADVMTAELDAEHAWTDAFVETAVRWIEPLA